MSLKDKKCVPCERGVQKLTSDAIENFKPQVPAWKVENDKLVRSFSFKDFAGPLRFVNKVGEIAEAENHHPEISFGWGHVDIEIWTHAINGLHENDFILATKIDELDGHRELFSTSPSP